MKRKEWRENSEVREEKPAIIFEEDAERKSTTSDNYCEWIESKNNNYIPTSPLIIRKKLPAGIYDISWDGERHVYIFNKQKLELDELLNLPNPLFKQILNDMEYFWDNEDKFKKYKFAYKRGILLHGPAGNGKTCLSALLTQMIIDTKQGVVFSIKSTRDLENYFDAVTKFFRIIEEHTPILTIIEDLDGLLEYQENETRLLNILDGFYQSQNIVYLGCTNYPEKLKDRILNRPSRFDKRYYIGNPEASVRKFYFEHKIKGDDLKKINIQEMVDNTEGLSLSHLGELIKSVFIFGKNIDESIQELKNMGKFISSTKYNDKPTGFTAGISKAASISKAVDKINDK